MSIVLPLDVVSPGVTAKRLVVPLSQEENNAIAETKTIVQMYFIKWFFVNIVSARTKYKRIATNYHLQSSRAEYRVFQLIFMF